MAFSGCQKWKRWTFPTTRWCNPLTVQPYPTCQRFFLAFLWYSQNLPWPAEVVHDGLSAFFHWRKRWFWSFSLVQQNMSNQISRYTSPPKHDRWFPYLFPWTMGELGKKSGCEILRSRVRPWWRSWLPSSMRSAERWLGGGTVTRLMNLKLWWDSLDSGIAMYSIYIIIYIYALYIIYT